jgi:RNA polymerase sigma-70 factor (ECF subfamily)
MVMDRLSKVRTHGEVDRLTFEEFYATEFDRVFDSAYSFCGDRQAALDATQEAFARAFARWWRLSRRDWAGAWVTTTALNVSRRAFRNAGRERHTQQNPVSYDPGQRVDLLAALRALPPRQRQAATLFYVADLPVAVVADTMNLSQGTVKAHLARARDHMRQSLEERDV